MEMSSSSKSTPNNLELFRLHGFSGRHTELLQLHEWIQSDQGQPAISISGTLGIGRSTLSTAIGWNHFYHFSDGIIRIGAPGIHPLRMYDIVRTMDSVFGTKLTRVSEDRWGISILEQLYRRRRLVIIDDLDRTANEEVLTLVNIIGHLRESRGHSRVVFVSRGHVPQLGEITPQVMRLRGLNKEDIRQAITKRAPSAARNVALEHIDELYEISEGHPFLLRLLLGMLLDYSWDELTILLKDIFADLNVPSDAIFVNPLVYVEEDEDISMVIKCRKLIPFLIENLCVSIPQAGPLLDRLVRAAGGTSISAVHELFWNDLGSDEVRQKTLDALFSRGLLDFDVYIQRVVMHPLIRSYLRQSSVMLDEQWGRNHARYYGKFAMEYQSLPLERWGEIDIEWGNVYQGAEWCTAQVERIWRTEPQDLIADPAVDTEGLELPVNDEKFVADLSLTRDYTLALAHYAFWRHPPGNLRWASAGAVSSLALTDMHSYGWLLLSIGRQHFFTNQLDESLTWMERARATFEGHDLLEELIYAHTDIATTMRVLERPRRALKNFRTVFELIAELGMQEHLATAYMNLGSAHYTLNDPEQALHMHQRALQVAKRRNNLHGAASAYNNLGLVTESMGRNEEAELAYKQALEIFTQIENDLGISICYNNLGAVHYAQDHFNRAITWYERDLELSERIGNWTDLAATYHNLGHVAIEMGDWEQAAHYFVQSRALYADFELDEYVAEEDDMLDYIQEQHPEIVIT